MECPKCNSIIKDNSTVCPKCHKVIALQCPNCSTIGESSVCQKCGYTILVKCSKCSKINHIKNKFCSKCGFSLETSLAYQECETDEFASIVVKFTALKNIRRLLKSQELYSKFYYKLKNLLFAQLKGIDSKIITYNDTFVINMNKELSFTTSSNKAVRLSLKIINAFAELNANVVKELGTPLNLTLTIVKKSAENLQTLYTYENDVKLLTVKKMENKYLRGLQVVLDQYVCDQINKEFKTDSLYSIEDNGKTISFYEIVLDSYVLPPSESENSKPVVAIKQNLATQEQGSGEKDEYSFKVFDINAKCSFEESSATEIFEKLACIDFEKKTKILALKSSVENSVTTSSLAKFFEKNDKKVLSVTCTEEMNYKPWGFFETLFKDYFGISLVTEFSDFENINPNSQRALKILFDLLDSKPTKALTPEDARFAYMEAWSGFLSLLKKTVIIVDGFEYLDDTSIQTLELYFDKFKNVKPIFVFLTSEKLSVHSKFKTLLRTPCYTEIKLKKSTLDSCLTTLKLDATDFIQSFYFEKIKENFNGSYLYFDYAVEYLKETGVLLEFENKLIVKNKKSVIIPKDLSSLIKSRMKNLSRDMDVSLIFAYSSILGARLDLKTLEKLGVKDCAKNLAKIADSNLARLVDNVLHINTFNTLVPTITDSLKKDAEMFLVKTVLSQLGKSLDNSTKAFVMGRMAAFKEEYLTLWKNAQFAMKTGDYDAYLKNCLGFLSLVEHIDADITSEEIEENKKEVYNNILLCLYSYSPAKIYFIENMLLMDAINSGDDEKIVKLSNLMLQGALISSNYTDAIGLLHNILARMQNPTLIVDGAINTRFLLLSLVNIEILYNIGDFRQCVEVAEEILSVLSYDVLAKVKPASFSTNLFVNHIMETYRLVAFAKLYLLDVDLEEFFVKINTLLRVDLPEKDCILAIKDYLAGKVYHNGIIEGYSAFSKVVFLILQEFSVLKDDYKRFAQNIYQAKLLASELHQREIELLCDLLIAYAYSKIGVSEKAEIIYADVLKIAEESALFNTLALAKYFSAKLKLQLNKPEEALLLVNDTLALLQKFDNQSLIVYMMFERLYIDIVKQHKIPSVDIEVEEQKLVDLKDPLKLFWQ